MIHAAYCRGREHNPGERLFPYPGQASTAQNGLLGTCSGNITGAGPHESGCPLLPNPPPPGPYRCSSLPLSLPRSALPPPHSTSSTNLPMSACRPRAIAVHKMTVPSPPQLHQDTALHLLEAFLLLLYKHKCPIDWAVGTERKHAYQNFRNS